MGLVVLSLLFYINLKRNKEEEIIFFSTKNPFVLIHSGEKGLLVLSSKIENPNFYKNTISKMLREEKIKVEKIIFIGDKFLENLIFTSKFCKIMYLPKSVLSPPLNQNKNIFCWEEEKNVIFDKFLISSIGGNLQIEYDNLKILILLNENLAEINYPCKYFLIYPVNFKKNEKNEQILNRLKPFFFIFQKRIKKFENLQSLCKNYYLNNSCVILNLKSKIIKYWRDNGKY
ncbi:MAG: hypothetical protein N2589_06070 [bacterium]|nr:hypothetical protein [bacterium]